MQYRSILISLILHKKMKEKLRNIIEDNTSKKGKIFDYFIQILILLSLIAFTIETLPNNSKTRLIF